MFLVILVILLFNVSLPAQETEPVQPEQETQALDKAQELFEKKKYQEAAELLRKAIAINPEEVSLLVQLAITLQRLDQYEESLQIAIKALELKEKSGEGAEVEYGLIATAYETLGKYEKAEDQFQRMVETADAKGNLRKKAMALLLLADLYLKQSNYNLASDTYKRVLAIHAEDKDSRLTDLWIEALRGEGNIRRSLRDYGASITFYQKYLEEVSKLPEGKDRSKNLIRAYRGIGNVYDDQGNAREARKFYELGYQRAQNSHFTNSAMDLLPDLVQVCRDMGDFDQSKSYLSTFLNSLERITDEKEKDDYLDVASNIYESLGDYKKALEFDQQRLELVKDKNRPLIKSECLESVGDDLVKLARYQEALSSFQQSLEIREKLPYPLGAAYCLRRIGDVKSAQGDYQKAKESYLKSKSIYQEIGRKDSVARRLVDLASLEYGLGNYEAARNNFREAQGIFHDLGHRLEEAFQYTNLAKVSEAEGENYYSKGWVTEAREKFQEALEFNKQALQIERELGDVIHTVMNLDLIGRQYLLLEDFSSAEMPILEALEVARKASSKPSEASVLKTLGELRWKQRRYEEAEQHLLKIKQMNEESGNALDWRAWYLLGRIQRDLAKKDAAILSLEKSIFIVETLRRATLGSPEQERLFLERYRDIYHDLIELLIEKGNLEGAYRYIEKEKIAEFHGEMPEQSVFGEDAKDAAYERAREYQFSEIRIKREIEEERKKSHPDEDVIENLKSLLGAIDKEFAIYITELKKKYPDVVEQLQGNPRSLRSMRASIPDGVIILQPVLLPAKHSVALLVYSNAASFVREVPVKKEEELSEDLQHFLDLLREEGEEAEIKESSSEFYDWLIRPIEREIEQANLLVVSASGKLRRIPYQALYDSSEQKYLIEKVPLVNLALLKQLNFAEQNSGTLRVFAMANPDPESPELALPKAEEQVLRIKSSFSDARIYLHDQATLNNLKWRDEDKNYDILLFATHAMIDADEPGNSHILLAEGQQLTYENIPQYSPYWSEVDLVVLSACETAVAPKSENSAIDSLAENFDLIGIRSVVASLWQVNDDSTSELMVRFFQNLKEGLTLAKSLQNAQLELLRNSKFSNPFHWAPFILFGDWR